MEGNDNHNGSELPESVLFVCNFNTVRSPMAEAIAKQLFGNKIYIESFGINEKLGEINPFAVTVLEEIGLDISGHQAKDYDDLIDNSFDLVIALSHEAYEKALELTRSHSTEVEYWQVMDPTGVTGNRENILSSFRILRDDLAQKIKKRLTF